VHTARHPQAKVARGLMTRSDMSAYHTVFRAPVTTDWRGFQVVGMPPPSSGGTTVLEALNILEAFGAPATDPVEELHRYLEASRLAYADRGKYLGDPDFVDVPTACLVSQEFADARQRLIGTDAAKSPVDPGTCPTATTARATGSHEGPNTTHMVVADKDGNVVSYTFTIEQTGGSGMVVPHRGFLLNNELTDFDFAPGSANEPGPRKRPRSSMAPTILLKDGAPALALGSPGGSTIITTVLQTLVNRYERGLSLPDAIAAPRVTEQNADKALAEPAFLGSPEAAALRARGHRFAKTTDPGAEIGALEGIEFGPNGQLEAAAEPTRRGGGSAMVVTPAGRR
jgi:gamma-glutamyltranspeptidase / glutathione hydrolase